MACMIQDICSVIDDICLGNRLAYWIQCWHDVLIYHITITCIGHLLASMPWSFVFSHTGYVSYDRAICATLNLLFVRLEALYSGPCELRQKHTGS